MHVLIDVNVCRNGGSRARCSRSEVRYYAPTIYTWVKGLWFIHGNRIIAFLAPVSYPMVKG
jgi:hypothetical protein